MKRFLLALIIAQIATAPAWAWSDDEQASADAALRPLVGIR